MSPEPEIFLMIPLNPAKGWKKEFGYYALAADGTLFLPGQAFHPAAFSMAAKDGEPGLVCEDEKIVLLRVEWLKKQYPARLREIERVERVIRQTRDDYFRVAGTN
jgi:hypothetical protein